MIGRVSPAEARVLAAVPKDWCLVSEIAKGDHGIQSALGDLRRKGLVEIDPPGRSGNGKPKQVRLVVDGREPHPVAQPRARIPVETRPPANRPLVPYLPGERIEILDEAMLKNGYRFGVVTKPRSPDVGIDTVTFTIEGDDSGDVCLLSRKSVKRA